MAEDIGVSIGEANILVSTDELKTKSAEVSTKVVDMRTHFDELKQCIEKTSNYWIGDGGDVHRKQYNDLVEKVEEILKRLGEHPKDLLQIAGVYSETEKQIEEFSATLPGDVIV